MRAARRYQSNHLLRLRHPYQDLHVSLQPTLGWDLIKVMENSQQRLPGSSYRLVLHHPFHQCLPMHAREGFVQLCNPSAYVQLPLSGHRQDIQRVQYHQLP